MHSYFLFIVYNILLFASSRDLSEIVRIPYYSYGNVITIDVSFGKSSKKHRYPINISSMHTWINSYCFPLEATFEDFPKTEIKIGKNMFQAAIIKDTVSFMDTFVHEFELFYARVPKYYTKDSGFSFCRIINKDKLSLISQLKESGVTNKLAFGFTSIDEEHGEMFIGGLEQKSIKNYTSSSCKVNQESYQWSCLLTGIIVNNQHQKNKEKMIFDTAWGKINFSNELFNSIEKIIKKEYCEVIEEEQGKYISCDVNAIENELIEINIDFIIEGRKYSMTTKELFNCRSGFNCKSLFMCFIDFDNIVVIGYPFLKKYTSYFDMEKDTITFYSKDYIPKYPEEESSSSFALTIIGICSLNLTLCIIFLYYIKKTSLLK